MVQYGGTLCFTIPTIYRGSIQDHGRGGVHRDTQRVDILANPRGMLVGCPAKIKRHTSLGSVAFTVWCIITGSIGVGRQSSRGTFLYVSLRDNLFLHNRSESTVRQLCATESIVKGHSIRRNIETSARDKRYWELESLRLTRV